MGERIDVRSSSNQLRSFLRPLLRLQEVLDEGKSAEEERDILVSARNKEEKEFEKFKLQVSEEKTKLGVEIQDVKKEVERINSDAGRRKEAASLLASQEREKETKILEGIKRDKERTQADYKNAMVLKESGTNDALDKAKLKLKDILSQTEQAEAGLISIKSRLGKAQVGQAQVEAS